MQAIRARSTSHHTRPGITVFEEGESFIPIENIAGVREAGWRPNEVAPKVQQTALDFAQLRTLHRELMKHSASWPFQEPVSEQEAPDYYKVIKTPQDLKTIGQRIKDKVGL